MAKIPETNKEGYKLLYILETRLRSFIILNLENKSKEQNLGGWVKLIPIEIIKRCEIRQIKENSYLYQTFGSFRLLDYSDFYDLKRIIIKNWDSFERCFRSQDVVNIKFDEIEPIRNIIAHNRELDKEELNRLKILYKDIMKCIK